MLRIALALLSSLILILSFPKFNLEFLSWFALVPLFLAIRSLRLKSVLLLCFLSGICFFMGVFYWINLVTGFTLFHFFIIMTYLALYFVVFGLLITFVSKNTKLPFIITSPVLWVSSEYLRSHAGFMGLPLALLGHTQYLNLPILQIASYTGAYGISFIIVLANSAVADLLSHWIDSKQKKQRVFLRYNPVYGVLAAFLFISVVWVAGWKSLPSSLSGKSFTVAVVQGNISQEIKWNREYRKQILSRYEDLSKVAVKSKPHLVAWPETSTPGFILKDIDLLRYMVSITRRFQTYFLVGSAEYPKFGDKFVKKNRSGNTALFFSPEGKILGQYVKIRLLPFGEYVPYEGIVPWPEFIVSRKTNFHVAGTEPSLFAVDGSEFSTLICWEILFPELTRAAVKKGAGFVVNISNEAWFGESAFPYQFLTTCVFRAVENRVNLVRATNTGISCFIDPYGRITSRITNGGKDIFVEGTLTGEIFLSPPGTFYTRYGDAFAYGCIAFSMGLVIWSFLRKPSRSAKGERIYSMLLT